MLPKYFVHSTAPVMQADKALSMTWPTAPVKAVMGIAPLLDLDGCEDIDVRDQDKSVGRKGEEEPL